MLVYTIIAKMYFIFTLYTYGIKTVKYYFHLKCITSFDKKNYYT